MMSSIKVSIENAKRNVLNNKGGTWSIAVFWNKNVVPQIKAHNHSATVAFLWWAVVCGMMSYQISKRLLSIQCKNQRHLSLMLDLIEGDSKDRTANPCATASASWTVRAYLN